MPSEKKRLVAPPSPPVNENKGLRYAAHDGNGGMYGTQIEEEGEDATIRVYGTHCWDSLRRYWKYCCMLILLVVVLVLGIVLILYLTKSDPPRCQTNHMKRSFPDIDYAMYGYNIMYGYPLATGHDPGLTYPIFVADYSGSRQTADCRYQIPKGYYLVPDVACVTSFSSKTVKDSSQFSQSMSVSRKVKEDYGELAFLLIRSLKRSHLLCLPVNPFSLSPKQLAITILLNLTYMTLQLCHVILSTL